MKGQRVACILIGAEVAALVAFFDCALVAQDIYSNIGEFNPGDELVRNVEWNRRTQTFGALRVRMVDYSPRYRADHWCSKGHILLCTEGVLGTELKDGRTFTLTPGMSYQVADGAEPHRSFTAVGAKLFIVD